MKRPIITLEDGTEVLSTTGDVDAFEHGGGVLFRDGQSRDIMWSFWEGRARGSRNYEVFTAPIPADVLSHFRPDIDELSAVTGMDRRDIKRMGLSKSHSERHEIVMAICECNGPSSVDSRREPEILDKYTLASRWGKVFANETSEVPMVELDDFIVRETKHEDYECGCVDGTYLGRHIEYKHALCAIRDFMREKGLSESNVFHEHEAAQLELVVWDCGTFVGKVPARRGKLSGVRWRAAMKRYASTEIHRKVHDQKPKNIAKKRRAAGIRIIAKERVERARQMRRSAMGQET